MPIPANSTAQPELPMLSSRRLQPRQTATRAIRRQSGMKNASCTLNRRVMMSSCYFQSGLATDLKDMLVALFREFVGRRLGGVLLRLDHDPAVELHRLELVCDRLKVDAPIARHGKGARDHRIEKAAIVLADILDHLGADILEM